MENIKERTIWLLLLILGVFSGVGVLSLKTTPFNWPTFILFHSVAFAFIYIYSKNSSKQPIKNYFEYCGRKWIPSGWAGLALLVLYTKGGTPHYAYIAAELCILFYFTYNFPRESHYQKYLAYMEKHVQKEQHPQE